ncbi:MAG: response regulator [Deltaproteobacteria bacterium]|nr:response regulator [Deltaproteobacteria bacterium]
MPKKGGILIVEDSPTQSMYLKFLLEENGYTVHVARDGREGLNAASENRPQLIISDVMMPEMTGYEMCRAIKDDPDLSLIPLILLTTLSDPEDIMKGLEAKADFYLTKPFDETALLSRVKDILDPTLELKKDEKWEELEIVVRGKRRKVRSTSTRIMNLLLSTYENAMQRNTELLKAQEELRNLNEKLEERVYELRVSDNRFRSLVKTIPDIVYRIDPQGRFTFINEAIERLGYMPEDLIGQHFSKIILPADVKRVDREEVLKKLKGKSTGDKMAPKLFNEQRTGKRKTEGLEVCLVPLHKKTVEPGYIEPLSSDYLIMEVNSSGMWEINPNAAHSDFLGTVGVIRDISVRKKMEKDLEEREAQMRTIFDYASAGIVVIDPEYHLIVDANPTAVKMIGVDKEDVVGAVCHRFICPAEEGRCPITDLNETVDNSERILITADGNEVPILKTVAPIMLKGRRHLLESFVDISQLKKTESELKSARDNLEMRVEERTMALKESQAQLIQAEKLGALGTLTAGIAHELNNPMMGMLNFAQYCKKHVDKETKVYSVLDDMERETKRCINIVKNLQTFSRMKSNGKDTVESISCGEIIERVHKLLSYRLEKDGVSFNVVTSPDCPNVSVDVSSIQQVFLNLISNAVDAVKDTESRDIDIQIDQDSNEHVMVRVADKGSGIPKDIQAKIFDPFYTTKGVGKGTGLGLSVSRGIVEKAGGSIEFSSETGKGTVFKVRLPV